MGLGEVRAPQATSFFDIIEAYSWGVCKYESEDAGDGFGEGVQWSSVADVQDSPALDVRNDSLDLVADLVDGFVALRV